MAKDEGKRKNFWEEEEEEEIGIKARRAGQTSAPTVANDSEEIDKKIQETKLLMDQTHQLYLHYINGIEKRVPIEKARLLETKVAELQRNSTNLTTSRFKIQQFLAQYSMMKELWERKLREREKR